MRIDSTLIKKDMKRAALFFGAVIFLSFAIWFLSPLYGQQRDKRTVSALETKVVPFLVQNDVKVFYDESDCKQIRYGAVVAASPKGCAYRENISDPSMKSIPDFTAADEKLFEMTRQILRSASSKTIKEIAPEYTSIFNANAPQTSQEIGIGFHVSCFFCRTRYVYWPNYKSLPSDWEGEISYTPINENWFRVDEDWN